MINKWGLLIVIILFFVTPVIASEFAISFEWGDIPLCTSGNPNVVSNPITENLDQIPGKQTLGSLHPGALGPFLPIHWEKNLIQKELTV
jgi:hypothetical protein